MFKISDFGCFTKLFIFAFLALFITEVVLLRIGFKMLCFVGNIKEICLCVEGPGDSICPKKGKVNKGQNLVSKFPSRK